MNSAAIQIHNLSLGYSQKPLLEQAQATLMPSTLTALIGRNGAGKSTLLKAIAGINTNYSGSVSLLGRDMRSAFALRAKTIAYVDTQRLRLPSLSCFDVVASARSPYTNWIGSLSPADRAIVNEALDEVGMFHYADRHIDTLSDGESQRIMIARALAQDTPIILLDEPTSFLDIPNRHQLAELLGRIAHSRHKCILFSTHELDVACKFSDALMIISNKKLVVQPTQNQTIEKILQFF